MTREERITLMRQAISAIEELLRAYPGYPPFVSINNQLLFLTDQVSRNTLNRDGLRQINLGYITMREVEPRDNAAADILYRVSAEAKKMLADASGAMPS